MTFAAAGGGSTRHSTSASVPNNFPPPDLSDIASLLSLWLLNLGRGEKCLYSAPSDDRIAIYETAGMDGNTPGQMLPVNYRLLQVCDLLLKLLVVFFLL